MEAEVERVVEPLSIGTVRGVVQVIDIGQEGFRGWVVMRRWVVGEKVVRLRVVRWRVVRWKDVRRRDMQRSGKRNMQMGR